MYLLGGKNCMYVTHLSINRPRNLCLRIAVVQGIRARSIDRDNGVGILMVSCNQGGE